MRHYAQGFEPLSHLEYQLRHREIMELPKSLVAGPTLPKWLWLRRLKGEV